MSNSSSANSFAVSSIRVPERETRRDAGSRTRSPACRQVGRSPAPRRTSARDPGAEFAEVERLGKVVVRAGVQALHAKVVSGAGGQHQHRGPPLSCPPLAHYLDSVQAGQHSVENDGVIVVFLAHPQSLVAVAGHVDGVPVLLQGTFKQLQHSLVVFDDQ